MSCGWIAGGGGGRKAPGYTTQKATMELAIDFSRLLDYTTRKTSIVEQNKLAALQMESLVVARDTLQDYRFRDNMELQFKYIAAAIVATMPLVWPGELDKL
ncbi:hypothetical protein F2Q69_00053816 [Brassica cretica]|uniref:Uncharacterized protein n=1 Tax=Brassica cretica TaxID=69181 RepID=A0A8S9MYL4_BRACR|nr:hypothetical protein F2Q69_00053816 [Brassica cretica]